MTERIPEMFDTISGNRGLDVEEPLIFEMDSPGSTGVDLPEPGLKAPRLGGVARRRQVGLPGLSEPEVMRPLHAAQPQEHGDRQQHVSAGLVHHEAQPADQREGRPPARLRRHPPAPARTDGAGARWN